MCNASLGDLNFAVDGVTANSKSYLLFTKMVGHVTQFVSLFHLGSDVHVTDAEVEAGLKVIMEVLRRIVQSGATPRNVASVNVDNGAAPMADKLTEKLVKLDISKKCVVVRDPSHCIDLGSKDLARTPLIEKVIANGKDSLR